MPELPEVEVTCRGLAPVLRGAVITAVYAGELDLREPLPREALTDLIGARITEVSRRGKYLLITCERGTLLVHLGMTGYFRIVPEGTPRILHDHFELTLDSGRSVRLNDARRFGLVAVVPPGVDPGTDRHLAALGPEPLSGDFDGPCLLHRLAKRRAPIKQALMDYRVVVGVGNIYASEALFRAGISPLRPANALSEREYQVLSECIAAVLSESIACGGTTIRDFSGADGRPGYFVRRLRVYGHAGEACPSCGTPIVSLVLGQRSTFYCPHCQS